MGSGSGEQEMAEILIMCGRSLAKILKKRFAQMNFVTIVKGKVKIMGAL